MDLRLVVFGEPPGAQIAPSGGGASICNAIPTAFPAVRFRRNADTMEAESHPAVRPELAVHGAERTSINDSRPPIFREPMADCDGSLMLAADRGIRAYFARLRTLICKLRIVACWVIPIAVTKSQFAGPFCPWGPFPRFG